MATAEEGVRQRIREKGRITFAEYMEVALYHNPGGYYTRRAQGAGRDYYTSPQAHPVFGALMALQLEQIWRLLGAPDPFHAVEPGAGDGTLARDVLAFAQKLEPAFAGALRYIAIDRAGPAAATTPGLQWLRSEQLPLREIVGCILSNELVDALPIHRVAMRRGRLRELYVALDGERLVETAGEPSTPDLAARLALEQARLEEGWEAEVNLQAVAWMQQAARSLARGYVLTIDYGDMAERLYTPERSRGTVVSYRAHAPLLDPYAEVGSRDITAHANFTTLKQAGAEAGLRPLALATQRRFLQNLGIDLFIEATRRQRLGQRELQANLMAQRDLVKPEGLGGFRVLLQSKEAPSGGLAGLGQDGSYLELLRGRLEFLPLPLLDSAHLDLLSARYPHLGGSWEGLLS